MLTLQTDRVWDSRVASTVPSENGESVKERVFFWLSAAPAETGCPYRKERRVTDR